MLISKTTYGYSRNKKHISGRGFVDTMSSVFKNIGSYVSTNKDLIAKPMLGAIGSLAATGLTAGVPALISHISKRNRLQADPKYKEILENIMSPSQATAVSPVTNIIGSGVRKVRRRGSGIKTF
jgi:hypothetical protein